MRTKLLSLFAASLLLAASASAIAGPAPDTPAPQSMSAEKSSTTIGVANNTIGNIVTLSTSASALEVAPMPGAATVVVDLKNSFAARDTTGNATFGAGQVTTDRIGHAIGASIKSLVTIGVGQLQLVFLKTSPTMIAEGADGTPTAVAGTSSAISEA